MKKFSSKVLAGIFTAALLAGGAFANDYVEDPNWSKPTTVEIGERDVASVSEGGTYNAHLYNDESGVELSEKALQTLKDKKAGITIYFNSGVRVKVTAVDLHDVKNFSFALGVSNVTGGTAVTDDKVEVPADSVLIQPAYNGDAFEATIVVPTPEGLDKSKAKLYHCDGKGGVEEVKDALNTEDYDTVSFKISHASYYVISAGEVKAAADAGQGSETEEPGASGSQASGSGSGEGGKGPNTGVTLPIALVALAGGSVAVSAIVAKKRK